MDLISFKESLQGGQPPAEISVYLMALWFEARGDWDKAHELVQDIKDRQAAWIHAYLHRREGDDANAGYWYHLAGRKASKEPLEKEWEEIAAALL